MELNKIYNEDCALTMERMNDASIDIVMTSPPYNMTKRKGGISDRGRYDVYKDWVDEDTYVANTVQMFKTFNRIVKPNGVVLYNFSYSVENPSLPYVIVADIVKNTEWVLADTIIWKKKNGMPFPANERRLSRIWEFVWVFVRKDEVDTFFCNKGVASVSEKTGQKYYTIYYNMVDAKNNDADTPSLNEATYSSELCDKLFSVYGQRGLTVYDPFMGTGTTAVSAIRGRMNFVGSEISSAQCSYATERIKDELAQPTLFDYYL